MLHAYDCSTFYSSPPPSRHRRDGLLVTDFRFHERQQGRIVLLGFDASGGNGCPQWGIGTALPLLQERLLAEIPRSVAQEITRWRKQEPGWSGPTELNAAHMGFVLEEALADVARRMNSEEPSDLGALPPLVGMKGFPYQFNLAALVFVQDACLFFHTGGIRVRVAHQGHPFERVSKGLMLSDATGDMRHRGISTGSFGFLDVTGHQDIIQLGGSGRIIVSEWKMDEAIQGLPETAAEQSPISLLAQLRELYRPSRRDSTFVFVAEYQ